MRPTTLTPRQAQAVEALANGHSMGSAAADMGIKLRTVRYLIEQSKWRLGALTIPHLVAKHILSQNGEPANVETKTHATNSAQDRKGESAGATRNGASAQ